MCVCVMLEFSEDTAYCFYAKLYNLGVNEVVMIMVHI